MKPLTILMVELENFQISTCFWVATMSESQNKQSLTHLSNLSVALLNKHFEASVDPALQGREQLLPRPCARVTSLEVHFKLFAVRDLFHRAHSSCSHPNNQV